MNAQEIVSALKKLGKPSTAAIYKRHGAGDDVFGVLTSELVKFQKKIKVDHALALELWKTGNTEARILALQVADPEKITPALMKRFAKEGSVQYLGCYMSMLAARSPIAAELMRDWTASDDEHLSEAGYGILLHRLKADPDAISDAEGNKLISKIEKEIHSAPNRVRHRLNGALIAIGVFKDALRAKAIATAKRIGVVEVDHGDTSCKTPDAAAYIERAVKRKK